MLRKMNIVFVVVLCSLNLAQADERNYHFFLDGRPTSFLLSPDLEGLTLRNAGNTDRDTIRDGASWTPSMNAGIGLNLDIVDLTMSMGTGFLLNDGFTGAFGQADISALFNLMEGRIQVGPRVGVLGLGDAVWDPRTNDMDEDHIDLDGNIGYKVGLAFRAGRDRFSFLANVDFVDVSYDVTTHDGWVAEDDQGARVTELDMSGMMIDLGLIFRF